MFNQRVLLLLIWTLAWSYGFAFSMSSWYYEALGMSPGEIQKLRAYFLICCLVFAPVAGVLADWLGRELLLKLGTLSLLLASGMYIRLSSRTEVMIAEGLIAFGQACLIASVPALLCRSFRVGQERAFAEVWGWALLLEAVYWVLINSAGGFIAKEFGVRANWGVSAGLYLLVFLLSFLVKRQGPPDEQTAPSGSTFNLMEVKLLLSQRGILLALILFGALSASYRAVMYLEPEYLKQSGFSKELAGVMVGVSYIPVGIVAAISGRFLHRLKSKQPERALFLAQGMSFFFMAIFFGGIGWLAVLIHTAVRGISRVKYFADANNQCQEACRGTCNGMLNFADRLGGALLLFTMGALLDSLGMEKTLIALSLIMGSVGLLLSVKALKR